MALVWRVLISIAAGWVFYAVLLFTVFRLIVANAMTPVAFRILLWNVVLWGRGEPIDHMPNGNPIYDGSVGLLGFPWEGIGTGFVIYPLVIFTGLWMVRKFRMANKLPA